MKFPLLGKIGLLVLGSTAFYTYIGQLVPQKEVQPPAEVAMSADMTTEDLVRVGREIAEGKGLCLTCHTIGKQGSLRFPDLQGIASRAGSRVPDLPALDYLAQSLYHPEAFIVPGFNPGMPQINKPPIGLKDQEILAVVAWLESLGGTPSVTIETQLPFARGGATPSAPAAGG